MPQLWLSRWKKYKLFNEAYLALRRCWCQVLSRVSSLQEKGMTDKLSMGITQSNLTTFVGEYDVFNSKRISKYQRCDFAEWKISMGYWPSLFGQDGWILAKFFFLRVYGPRRSRAPWTRKKRTRPISSHLDRTNLVNKGFIIWLLVKFCLRDTAGSSEWARWLHLSRAGSQSQRAIWFILPARLPALS